MSIKKIKLVTIKINYFSLSVNSKKTNLCVSYIFFTSTAAIEGNSYILIVSGIDFNSNT